MNAGLFAITIEEQIAEVERELKLREHVYPRWVGEKKMRQEKADKCMAAMRAVLETLQSIKEKTNVSAT